MGVGLDTLEYNMHGMELTAPSTIFTRNFVDTIMQVVKWLPQGSGEPHYQENLNSA